MSDAASIRVDTHNGILTLAIDNPAKRNALNPVLLQQILDHLDNAATDPLLRVAIIRGTGDKAFCSGYDIAQLPSPDGGEYDPSLFDRAMRRIAEFPLPVIAMVNGHAFGGGAELAMSADIRLGASGIKIGIPPAKLGIVYSEDGIQKFINAAGLSRARWMFFTGEPVDAPTALAWGLLDEVIEGDQLEARVRSLAETIAANAPLSLRGMKRITTRLAAARLSDTEREEILRWRLEAFMSADMREGQAAFMEKRKPKFEGR